MARFLLYVGSSLDSISTKDLLTMQPLESPKSSGGGGSHKHSSQPVHKKPQPQQETKVMSENITETAPDQQPTETYDTLIMKLTARKEEWIKDYAGKVNYNPYLEAARHIDPLIKQFQLGQVPIQVAVQMAMQVPSECPCIDKNYVPPKPEPNIIGGAQQFGAKNVPQG